MDIDERLYKLLDRYYVNRKWGTEKDKIEAQAMTIARIKALFPSHGVCADCEFIEVGCVTRKTIELQAGGKQFCSDFTQKGQTDE